MAIKNGEGTWQKEDSNLKLKCAVQGNKVKGKKIKMKKYKNSRCAQEEKEKEEK